MSTHIELEAAPVERRAFPAQLPFPTKSVVTIGHKKSDICLLPWARENEGRKKNQGHLYSPHVQLCYFPAPDSSWHLLSLRGCRRGPKAVFVDDKHIYSKHGLVPVRDGTRLTLGEFVLRFRQDTKDDYCHFESPSEMVHEIERGLREVVEVLRMRLPDKVYSAERKAINWNRVYLYQLLDTMLRDSSPLKPLFVERYGSKTQARKIFNELNKLRDHACHPSKGELDSKKKKWLADVYIDVMSILKAAVNGTH